MRGELSRTTKLFQNELRLANQIVVLISYDSSFHTLILSKMYRFSIFSFRKIIGYELTDSQKIQGVALIYEQSRLTYVMKTQEICKKF